MNQPPSFVYAGIDEETLRLQEELQALGGGKTKLSTVDVYGVILPNQGNERQTLWTYDQTIGLRDISLPTDSAKIDNIHHYPVNGCTTLTADEDEDLSQTDLGQSLSENICHWITDGYNTCLLGLGMRNRYKTKSLFGHSGHSLYKIDAVPTSLYEIVMKSLFHYQKTHDRDFYCQIALSCWVVQKDQLIDLIVPHSSSESHKGKALDFSSILCPTYETSLHLLHEARMRCKGCLSYCKDSEKDPLKESEKAHCFVRILLHKQPRTTSSHSTSSSPVYQESDHGILSCFYLIDLIGFTNIEKKYYQSLSTSEKVIVRERNLHLTAILQLLEDMAKLNQPSISHASSYPPASVKEGIIKMKDTTTNQSYHHRNILMTLLAPIIQGNVKSFLLYFLQDSSKISGFNENKKFLHHGSDVVYQKIKIPLYHIEDVSYKSLQVLATSHSLPADYSATPKRVNKNNQISGYPSPGETSQATDYGDINFDQILNDHYIALPKSAAAQSQIHTKKMTSHNDKEIIPSPFPVPSPARSSYSPPPHKTPNLPSSPTINNSGGNKGAVRDIMDEFYSVMRDIQDSTGVFNPVPYAASKIDVDYDLIKATTRSSFVNNVDVIEETHRMYHEYESEQPDRQTEESGFWPPWKAPLAQTNQFMEEKKGGMPSLVSSLENTQQWRRNIEIDESGEESDEEEDMERQFEKNAAMEEALLSGIGGLTAIPIMTTTYRDEGRNTEPSTQFHPSSTSRYFSNSHSREDVGVEEEDESEVFLEGEAESNNNESENADLSEEMIDEMLFLPNSVAATEGVRSSRSKSLRFSENNDENEEDSTLPVNDGHQLEINQEKAEKRSLLREIEANLPQSRSRRPPSQRSPSSSVSQSQSTYATTEIFQSSGLQYDENIPSIQHFSTLPLALQEIEKLNRIKESLLDALYDTKQQLAHTQDTVTQEKEKNYELTTLFEIEKENQRLQTLSLQQQIRILTQEHSIQEIYQIYEKDLQRLKQENERLYDRNLTLELQYESSGVVPSSQVTHSPHGSGKGAGNSAQRKGVSGRIKVAPTSDEDEMRQIEREEKHIQQIQHASDVISVRNKEEGEGRRGKEGILKASSDGGDPSSQLTVTTYEYQQLLKRYQTLIQKYKQCAIEKQSWKQSYETLKSQDRKHHLHEKLYTDLQLRHKKISYEYQQMKQVIDKQSQQLLEKQKDYQTIINDYNELKRENKIIKKEQSEYLMKIQQATKVIHELREEKTRLTHFYQFLYKHQAKGLITSLSPPVMKDLQNMFIDDVLEREEREEERRKKRDTVRMKDENRMVEPYQSHEQSRKNNKKEVFGKNYQLALQNFYKYYNDDMTTTKIPTPSSLHTMAAVKSEIAKNMASDGMMGLGNASDKENHQFLRTMETERLIQNSDGRKGGANNRISTRVEPRSYSTKYSHSPGAASTPIPAPKSWKK